MIHELILPGEPQPYKRGRAAHGGNSTWIRKDSGQRAWEDENVPKLEEQWKYPGTARKKPVIGTPLAILVFSVHKRIKKYQRKKDPSGYLYKPTRPDVDNYLKLILDVLQKAEILEDDGLVVLATGIAAWSHKDEYTKERGKDRVYTKTFAPFTHITICDDPQVLLRIALSKSMTISMPIS